MSIYRELSYEHDFDTIKGIQFCVLSPEEIEARSVAEIFKTETYNGNVPVHNGLFDPRMGVIEYNQVCVTCEQKNTFCPGHFGHIKLAKPVFHIQFFDTVRKILRCVCTRCSKLLIDPEGDEVAAILSKKYSRQKRWDAIYKLCSKKKRCGQDTLDGCGVKVPTITKENMLKIGLEWSDVKEDTENPGAPIKKQILSAEDVLRILRRISDRDAEILGFNRKYNRPEWMICTVFPVPPPTVRPSVRTDTGGRQEDDLTHKLSMIVKINNQIKGRMEKASDRANAKDQIDMMASLLQWEIATMIDNTMPGIPPSKQRTGRPMRSLTERLKSKEGRIRGNLMGKRVDFSARSVITPDPNISIDELGVPIKIAMNLTFPEVVNKYNKGDLMNLVMNGPDVYPGAKTIRRRNGAIYRIKPRGGGGGVDDVRNIELQDGDIVDRHLRNGDVVLFNRQPSLHRMSMMSHRVRVMPYNTFRLNVTVTPSYNADFDGDEMNAHVPQSHQTAEELIQLASVSSQIISPRECKPIISIVQDIVSGLYSMTKGHVRINEKQLFNLLCSNPRLAGVPTIANDPFEGRGLIKKWTGRQLLTSILPEKVNLVMKPSNLYNDDMSEKENRERGAIIEVKDGVVLDGNFTKDTFQAQSRGIIHQVFNEYGPDETRILFDNTQQLVCNWLVLNGFSVGISDMIMTPETMKGFKDEIRKKKNEVYDTLAAIHKGMLSNNTTRTNQQWFEEKVNAILNQAVKIAEEKRSDEITDNTNRLLNMINSKAKGQSVNLNQMMACVGQQNVDGKRIPYGFDDRTLPHYTKYDDGPESRGFIENSFVNGLTPQEFYFAAMGGREGLIDTAVQTSETGYIQRKLVKAMEDCKVNHDMTVRNANGTIIQFLYGEDGMDACKIESQFLSYIDMDPDRIIIENIITPGAEELANILEPSIVKSIAKDKGFGDKMKQFVQTLLDDREHVICNMFQGKKEASVMYPVGFARVLEIASNMQNKHAKSISLDLDPRHILEQIDHLCKECVVSRNHAGNRLFQILVRMNLSPRKIILKHRLSRASFDFVVNQIKYRFFNSMVDPSEMVGVIAAQSIGEPATQLSCSRATQAIVQKPDGSVFKGTIGDLIDGLLEANKKKVVDLGNDSVVMDLDLKNGYKIIGVSNEEKTSWRPISQISRHPANGGMVRIFTRSGRTTCATLSHSFLKRVEGGIVPVKGSELQVGNRVPITKYIPEVPEPMKTIKIGNTEYDLDRELGWFFGNYLADGSTSHNQVSISKVIPEVQDKLRSIIDIKFGKTMKQSIRLPGEKPNMLNGYDMSKYPGTENRFYHPEIAAFLEPLGDCYTKRVPAWVFASNRDFIRGLIGGYFDGDGNVNSIKGKQMIRSGSVCEGLTEDIIILLAYVGISATKALEIRKEENRDNLHTAQIGRKYARRFKEEIGFIVESKSKELDSIIDYIERDDIFTNSEEIDRIPELGAAIALIGKELALPGQSRNYGRWVKKDAIGRETLRKYLGIFEQELINREAGIPPAKEENHGMTGRRKNKDVEKEETEEVEVKPKRTYKRKTAIPPADFVAVREKIAIIKQALYSDVIWDEIIKIEYLDDPKEFVYDFTVPGNDSFMVDCGVLVHNTLNTFHMAGVSAASKAVRGVPRLNELLSVSKNIKAPIMKIHINEEHRANRVKCLKFMNDIRTVKFKDIAKASRIYYDPNDFDSRIPEDKQFLELYKEFNVGAPPTTPWVLRLELDKAKMNEYSVDMITLHNIIDSKYEEHISCMYTDDNAEKLVMRIKLNFKEDIEPDDMLTELKALEHSILETVKINGVKGIERASLVFTGTNKNTRRTIYNRILKKFEDIEEYFVYTDGSNMRDVLALPFVDPTCTITNDINEIYEVLGIEAARQMLYNEIVDVLDNITVNFRHIALLVDVMTNKGNIISVNRHGINRGDIGPLAKCSFEETTEKLIKAGVFAEFDKINGVAANIMLGQVAPAGTGDVDVLIDEGKLGKINKSQLLSIAEDDDDELEQLCEKAALDIKLPVPALENQELFVPKQSNRVVVIGMDDEDVKPKKDKKTKKTKDVPEEVEDKPKKSKKTKKVVIEPEPSDEEEEVEEEEKPKKVKKTKKVVIEPEPSDEEEVEVEEKPKKVKKTKKVVPSDDEAEEEEKPKKTKTSRSKKT